MTESLDYYRQAHRIAFAPLLFQATRVARESGLFKVLDNAGPLGASPVEAAAECELPLYATRVLLEGCVAAGAADEEEGRFRLSPVGMLLLHDRLVRVNMDFSHEVCHQGSFYLDESLREARPAGLGVFGPWSTIYEGLSELPERTRASWLAFDHLYSDSVFPLALESVFDRPTRRLLDVGGNTGKWALLCLETRPELEVTLLDHPSQVRVSEEAASQAGFKSRFTGHGLDLMDHSQAFPADFDVVWMSQFLDCFAESDVVHLLKRGRQALAPGGRLLVLEPCWDLQPNPAARDAVLATSLYFACMANGTSRMFHSSDLASAFAASGLSPLRREQLGFHTLFTCMPL